MDKRKIVLAGGSGFLGQILLKEFKEDFDIVILGRAEKVALPDCQYAQWDGQNLGEWSQHIDGAAVVINLTGRSVNCRYTKKNKELILQSRLQSTRVIGEAIAAAAQPPELWLNASSATIYPHTYDVDMDEDSPHDLGGFSEDVCRQWEEAFYQCACPQTRRCSLRISIAFGPEPGGACDVLTRLVTLGLGGQQGPGDQVVSWIHTADVARAVRFMIDNDELTGPINLATPHPVSNAAFMRLYREAAGMKIGLPAPTFGLYIGAYFMGTEPELILKSRRVVPKRLLDAGFSFHYPVWSTAIEQILKA